MIEEELSERQEEYLTFICEYQDLFGRPPTFREIAKGVGVKHAQSVKEVLVRLDRKGWIDLGSKIARCIRINYYPPRGGE